MASILLTLAAATALTSWQLRFKEETLGGLASPSPLLLGTHRPTLTQYEGSLKSRPLQQGLPGLAIVDIARRRLPWWVVTTVGMGDRGDRATLQEEEEEEEEEGLTWHSLILTLLIHLLLIFKHTSPLTRGSRIRGPCSSWGSRRSSCSSLRALLRQPPLPTPLITITTTIQAVHTLRKRVQAVQQAVQEEEEEEEEEEQE
jgi:hypothetical protein